MADFLYEETIKLNSFQFKVNIFLKKEEEIAKYFINEDFLEIEKISFIIKRGLLIQKSSLLQNLSKYIKNRESIEYIINNVIEYIEIWEESLQTDFISSIFKIFKNNKGNVDMIYEGFINIFNKIIKYFIKMISTNDKNTNDYILTLNEIVIFISGNQKIKVENDIIDFVLNLGSYGKSILNRKYCVYFSSCLIQINLMLDISLVNRVIMLSSDTEKLVKYEISYHFRFILKELDELYIKKNLFRIMDGYLSDEDINLKVLIYESILMNLRNINDEGFNIMFSEKIEKNFEDEYEDNIKSQVNIVKVILRESFKNKNIGKYFIKGIKNFFKKNYINIYKSSYNNEGVEIITNMPKIDLLVEEFYLISDYLDFFNEGKLLGELFSILVNCCCDAENPNHKISNTKSNTALINCKNSYNISSASDMRVIFMENLCNIMKYTPKYYQNKMLTPKLISLFNDCISNRHVLNIFFKNLSNILEIQNNIENDEFFDEYMLNWGKINDYILSIEHSNWREIIIFLNVHREFDKFFSNEDFILKSYHFIKNFISNCNFQVQTEAIKYIVKILKYGNKVQQEEMIKYANELLNNKNFYTRRLFYTFIEEAFEVFSSKFMKDNHLYESVIKILYETSSVNLARFFRKFPLFYPFLIENDVNTEFHIGSRIEIIKKSELFKDRELVKHLRNFEKLIEDKESLSELFETMKKNDRLKYDKEVLFHKEKSRQNIYSLGGLVGTSEMDDFFKIRIKNLDSIKSKVTNMSFKVRSTKHDIKPRKIRNSDKKIKVNPSLDSQTLTRLKSLDSDKLNQNLNSARNTIKNVINYNKYNSVKSNTSTQSNFSKPTTTSINLSSSLKNKTSVIPTNKTKFK